MDLAVIPGRLIEGRPIASADSGGLLDSQSDYRNDTAGRSGGQEGCFRKPTIASRHYDSPSEEHGIDRLVNTDWSEQEERPGTMKQVILTRPTADREGFSSAAGVHTAVTMFSAQPVAAGLSDPIAVHHSVHVHDNVSLGVSGPVSRDSHSEFRQSDVLRRLTMSRISWPGNWIPW